METTSVYAAKAPIADLPDTGLAVSWGAVFAGAAAAAAFSLILLVLGTGLGLTALSPWGDRSGSAAKFGFAAIVWVMVTQVMASGLGGYLAGRLRARYVRAQTDETYFRDTAHGFLSWAIATLFAAGVLASVLTGAASTVARATAESAGGPSAYLMDSLLRRDLAASASNPLAGGFLLTPETRAEIGRIYAQGLTQPAMPEQDLKYVSGLVSASTGASAADAQRRVEQVFTQTKEAADKARKALIHATLWLFISFLAGAFSASWFAIHGGRERDL
jgi:hypothetical protein